ncbi:protealysin inhibitor emfourin [Benzoatithermus flavus]|uniref:Protealysin inhibitor emfourin n=1 Tax=Benzoatithermus flavus TaxID=3108223 RepID=A0ABU8XSQ4_9PROT
MRIVFEMPATGIGFFPGLARPVVIEADRLPPDQASELCELIAATRFFERPERAPAAAARGAADCRQYAVTVEEDGRCRTLHVAEPIVDPDLLRLVRLLEAIARSLRRHT